MKKQLQSELSHEELSLSSPSPERLRAWRLYFERALALIDVLDAELERDAGIPMRWYDALVQLEETPEGLRMNELAERILYSKSCFTRVVGSTRRGRLRPPNPPRERSPLSPRRPHGRRPQHDGASPPPAPTCDRPARLPPRDGRRCQGTHPRAREDQ